MAGHGALFDDDRIGFLSRIAQQNPGIDGTRLSPIH
jgi:hypothetical protein